MDSQGKAFIYSLLRQGATFRRTLKSLNESQYYSAEQLTSLQNSKLSHLVEHCYKNVPYYTELFDKLQLKPDDIKTKEDLTKLPYLDKLTVRGNYNQLIARNKSKIFCGTAETSGTTGTPSKFLRDFYSVNFENAALWRFREKTGGNGVRKVVLRGDIIVPVEQDHPPFWKEYPLNNELYLSSYHISEENAEIYYQKISEFGAESIYAFPSSVYLLAKYFHEKRKKFELKAVFTSSESISDRQRALIEEVFMCRLYDWYGQVERVSAIGQCEKGTYHIIEDYSITETVDTGCGYELVGTNLNNYIMPLIRFRTGDLVTLGERQCSCGRNFREISKIQGRSLEYILTPDGKRISLFLVSDSIDFDDHVSEAQFIHNKRGEMIINIVAGEKYSEKDRIKIIKTMKDHTSPDMVVTVNEVTALPRGANGKVVNTIARVSDNINC
jgi:phenylacetate-CoA ligase